MSQARITTRRSTGLLASRSLERRVPLRGKLNSQLASCCIARLLVLATEDRQKPIITYIDSPTGEASGALSVISTMNGIQSPVVTFSRGVIGGAAAVVAAHGLKGFRTAHPNAEFSLKLGAGPEIDGNTQPQESYVKMLTQLLAKDTGRPEEEVFGWLTHGIQFSAQEAVRHGLIDAVATEPVLPKPA